jgi:hypothetical protein
VVVTVIVEDAEVRGLFQRIQQKIEHLHQDYAEHLKRQIPTTIPMGMGCNDYRNSGHTVLGRQSGSDKLRPEALRHFRIGPQTLAEPRSRHSNQVEVIDDTCQVAAGNIPSEKLGGGFERISLAPGETKMVALELPGEELAFYDVKTHSFVVEPGKCDVLVGSSSADIRATGQFEVTATK